MRIFYCKDHSYAWPVGVCSIVVARDADHARELLDKALSERHLKTYAESPYTFTEIDPERPQAMVILDGTY